jgi:metal-sulfur cluster biosynthetic enzyme
MPTEKQVISTLKEVIDPHTNISVYEMGLISELKISKSSVSLTFRPTSPFCPLGAQLAQSIKHRLESLKGVSRVNVKIVGHVHEDRINDNLATHTSS